MKKRAAPTRWHKLDNTANIFPVVASRRYSNVFRLTAVMREAVDPALLQQALEQTLPYFAAFNVRLRHGLFWNYLETNRATPQVLPEQDAPCRYIDPVETGRFLFRVLYYGSRVHLETFHVLTDGTGAMQFLKAVCYRYCQLAPPDAFTPEQLATPNGTETAGEVQDGYLKHYVPAKSKTFREPGAYHLRGEHRIAGGLGVATALMPVDALKAECRRFGATVGEYLTAAIAYGVYEEYTACNGAKRPVSIFVPVNLRPIFGTETSLNFFSNLTIILPLARRAVPFEDVMEAVKCQFAEKLTREEFEQKLAFTAGSEKNLITRIIPLPLKNGILRIVYEHSNNGSTLVFSNLGPVRVEEPFRRYFEGFRFLLSTTPREPVKATACACGNTLALTFTTEVEDNRLARSVVRRLAKAGVPVTLETGGDTDETLQGV